MSDLTTCADGGRLEDLTPGKMIVEPETGEKIRLPHNDNDRRDFKPTDVELRNRFFYHPPTPDTLPRFATVNEGCFALAKLLRDTVPKGRGLSLALTHLEDCRMRANFGIATETSAVVVPQQP